MSTKTQALIALLQDLKVVDYSTPESALKSNAKSERTLDLIFDIGRRGISYSAEDKKAIGSLFVDAIKPIQINIERAGCLYRTHLDNSVLRKRSALQFITDNYGVFPTGVKDRTLSTELSRLQASIKVLDNIITRWKEDLDTDETDSEQDSQDTTGLPPTHNWWSK